MLEISFADGNTFRLPCEFLRVYSPSAEVRGHGPGQEVLQVGKKDVEITHIEPVGTYAIQPTFPMATVPAFIRGIFSTTTDSARKKCGGSTSSAWRERERAASPRAGPIEQRPKSK